MIYSPRVIAIVLLATIGLSLPTRLVSAQETRERSVSAEKNNWPTDSKSVVKTASENGGTVTLAEEPVMRIALSTGSSAATISTTAKLLNVSDTPDSTQALETTRVRIESRMLTPARTAGDHFYELTLANRLSREDADRLNESVRQNTDEQPQVLADADKWKVILPKQSTAEIEETRAKLDDAGFEIVSISEAQQSITPAVAKNSTSLPASSATKIKYTARAASPSRELVAFARGSAPSFRSSAPLVFASSDEKNSPVRFNEKPYRGKIEVFPNTHGSVTVVNVIGLEDYVRGVVPNELSYPALEALKAQAIAARTYAVKNRGQFAAEGFDLLPTTRSQVYRGLSSETSLTSQAVELTRGVIATYNGEPINALYTSTCGGRTEDAENIFNEAIPYLRGRECAVEGKSAFSPFTIKSSRDLFEIKDERDLIYARDVAVLTVSGFPLPADKISSSWLSAHVSDAEISDWLNV